MSQAMKALGYIVPFVLAVVLGTALIGAIFAGSLPHALFFAAVLMIALAVKGWRRRRS